MTDKEIFERDAETIVDILYDKGYFREDLKRADMRAIEEYIAYVMNSKFETHVASEKLLMKITMLTGNDSDNP